MKLPPNKNSANFAYNHYKMHLFLSQKIGLKSYYILVPFFFCAHPYNCIIKLLNKILKINTYAKMAIFGVRQIYLKSNNFKSSHDIKLIVDKKRAIPKQCVAQFEKCT